jgi:hypothetical protein
MHRPAAIGALLILALAAAFAQGERPLYDARFFEPVEEVVTPHIAWAKPYGTPPKVLFITHRQAMREVIELGQRLEMDYKVFAMDGPGSFGETGLGVDASWRLVRGNSYDELAVRLRGDLAKDYDVIVLGNIQWDKLPMEFRYEILKKLKEGTGLVGVVTGRDQYIDKLLKGTQFGWNWATWSGGSQGIEDFFGVGVFDGGVDYTTAHSGSASIRLHCDSATRGSRESPRAGYSPGTLQLEPNTEYVFSAWTKTEGLKDGGASVSLYPQPSSATVKASPDWQRTEVRFKTDATRTTTGVYVLIYQPGTVWFDDLQLTKVGDGKNLLPNPSFEFPGPSPVEIAQGVPFQLLPAFEKHKDGQAFLRNTLSTTTFGRGRLGVLSFSPPSHQMLTPAPTGPVTYSRQDYDYLLEYAARLILWGARKMPPVVVAGDSPITVQAGEPITLPVSLTATSAATNATLLVDLRDQYGRSVTRRQQTVSLQAGANSLEVSLPALAAGKAFANLWTQSEGKVTGFGTVGLRVESPTRFGAFSLAQESFALREPLAGKLTVEGTGTGLSMRLLARDLNGRLVAEQTQPIVAGENAFRLPMPPMITIMGWLEAQLLQEGRLLDTRRVDFGINNLPYPRDEIQYVMWMGYPNDYIGPMMAEEFSRRGVDSFYDGGNVGYGPYANQRWLPYATRFTDSKTDWYQPKPTRQPDDLVRSPCLTDPAYRAKVREDLTKVATRGLRYGVSDFTLGDENLFVSGRFDLCFSDTCVEDFRRWARETYGTVAALNAEWGSHFADWSEVKPQTLVEAKKAGNLVPWVDHRLHMDSVWAGIHDYSRGVIKEVVPHARVGYEGSDTHVSTWSAADYWKLAGAMDLNNIYYRDFLSLAVKDFASPNMLLGAGWFGGYPGNRNEPFMRWFPWRTLFKGANSFWVWCGYGSPGAVMAYDVSLYPFFEAACQEVARIKQGPGKLLMNARRQHDGIALLWSAPSLHVGTATEGYPDLDSTLNSVVKILHDTGLEARVLSGSQLAAGKLSKEEFKVLLLPGTLALSQAEIKAIRQFVSKGGTVIADLRPGVTDEHGKPYDTWPLADLFGARLTGPYAAGNGDLTVEGTRLGAVTCDTAVAGTGAGQIAGTPVLISNKVEGGQAILLNFSLKGYLSLPKAPAAEFAGWKEGAGYREFIGGLMARAGVTPKVTVTPDAPQVEISRFAQGGAEYVGIIQSLPLEPIEYTNHPDWRPAARPVTLHFGARKCVYDVLAGRYLGETETVKSQLTPGVAQLYALLPYRLDNLTVEAPTTAAVGTSVRCSVGLVLEGQPAVHCLRLSVFGPDGKERPWYAANLLTGQGPDAQPGRGEATFDLALDDTPGAWKLVATDTATGVSAAASLQVTAR